MSSDRRLKGHPQLVAKYEAEGRARPVDPWETAATVGLHAALPHQDARVVLGADGAPLLTDAAVEYIAAARDARRAPARDRRPEGEDDRPRRSWLTVSEVARILELDEHIIRRAIARGAFPAEQPTGQGGLYRIRPARLEAHLYATGHAHEQIREWMATASAWLAASDA
jgi:excisionase family DNA binding protein